MVEEPITYSLYLNFFKYNTKLTYPVYIYDDFGNNIIVLYHDDTIDDDIFFEI